MKNDAVRRLLFFAAPLTFLVVVAGAFTRLSDAGLGCPDWPTCYGQIVGVPDAAAAAAHSPDSPLDSKKAWIEIAHRYIAALLGLVVFAAAVLSLRSSESSPKNRAPLFAAVLVILQALLGMLTVTERLRPIVVSVHLMGGVFIFAVLVYAQTRPFLPRFFSPPFLRAACVFAATILAMQIFLGGWVSANYAALSCPDFPRCGGEWLPPTTDWGGFAPGRELHLDSSGAPISAAALATIHWTHRAFAVFAAAVLGGFGILLWRAGMRGIACGLWFLLAVQIALGIVNVLAGLPLWSALSHNAVAALLAAQTAAAAAKIFRKSNLL
ncbi:MAG: COX15/CtaA family protein [Gammaproteobacteria bacterium]